MIAGVICGSKKFIASLIDVNTGTVMLKGPVMDPRIAHELYLRLDHLPIRIKAHSAAALYLAEHLTKNNISVIYPGLARHAQHAQYQQDVNFDYGFGGMMAIEMENSEKAMQLAQQLQNEKFGLYAVSLGFSRTLMTVPAVTTSSEISEEDQKRMKLPKGLLRLSIGYIGNNDTLLKRFLSVYNKVK